MNKRNKQWHQELKQSVLADEEACAEYNAFKLQVELSQALRDCREQANITQAEVAHKLRTSISMISRLDAGDRNKHSPSLDTLVKYANALGYRLKFTLQHA